MTKRILTALLALLLLCAMSLSGFAAELEGGSGDVNVSIDSDGDGIPDEEEDPSQIDPSAVVYSVIVTWESMDFMFSGTWDSEDAEYKGEWKTQSANGVWTVDSVQTLNVENRSNAAVTVSASMDETVKNGVSAALSANASGTHLGSAAVAGAVQNGIGPNVDFSVTVSGNPTVSDGFKVGTITVTFSKN